MTHRGPFQPLTPCDSVKTGRMILALFLSPFSTFSVQQSEQGGKEHPYKVLNRVSGSLHHQGGFQQDLTPHHPSQIGDVWLLDPSVTPGFQGPVASRHDCFPHAWLSGQGNA